LAAKNAELENARPMMSENEGPNRSMENAGLKMQDRKMLDRIMLDQNFVIKMQDRKMRDRKCGTRKWNGGLENARNTQAFCYFSQKSFSVQSVMLSHTITPFRSDAERP